MRTDFGCITDYNKSLLYHDVDETSGQSGAPLIVEHSPGKYTVIGINSGGFDSTSNRAVRTTDTVRDLILKAHNYEP